jgi:hypothetical protein
LKLNSDELLSTFAFNCNVRRYAEGAALARAAAAAAADKADALEVGRCWLTLSNPHCKRLE